MARVNIRPGDRALGSSEVDPVPDVILTHSQWRSGYFSENSAKLPDQFLSDPLVLDESWLRAVRRGAKKTKQRVIKV